MQGRDIERVAAVLGLLVGAFFLVSLASALVQESIAGGWLSVAGDAVLLVLVTQGLRNCARHL